MLPAHSAGHPGN